ncbi:hypothetical protein D9619_006108 [Psilocybe cf. subviscida]|uniref:Protein kinase domain-containing protein n=1 Tax=Psilocybe cf. subviscida TaxID=2480587 RepID=A0A8H5EY35_9AGAR|nr:hypothetical protein D9619_006108 [Psilocybe cf. subviscida]
MVIWRVPDGAQLFADSTFSLSFQIATAALLVFNVNPEYIKYYTALTIEAHPLPSFHTLGFVVQVLSHMYSMVRIGLTFQWPRVHLRPLLYCGCGPKEKLPSTFSPNPSSCPLSRSPKMGRIGRRCAYDFQFLTCETHQVSMENLDDVKGYASFYFQVHPTKPRMWKILGRWSVARTVDSIVHTSREATVPTPMEDILNSSPYIMGVRTFGWCPNWTQTIDAAVEEDFIAPRNMLCLQQNLQGDDSHRTSRDASATRRQVHDPAQGISGPLIYAMAHFFLLMTECSYARVEATTPVDAVVPPISWTEADVVIWLQQQIEEMSGKAFTVGDNIFDQGIGSLSATILHRRTLGAMIYNNPTFIRLAGFFAAIVADLKNFSASASRVDAIYQMITKYSDGLHEPIAGRLVRLSISLPDPRSLKPEQRARPFTLHLSIIMVTDPELVKTFNYLLCGLKRPSAVYEIQLPVNRQWSECKDRVNEVLREQEFLADIKIYKPQKPLPIIDTGTDEWLAFISNPQNPQNRPSSNPLKYITPRSSLSTYFPEDHLDDDNVHLVVVASWKDVDFNYILFDNNHSWDVHSIPLPVNRTPEDCLERVAQTLRKWEVIADLRSIKLYKPQEHLLMTTAETNEWRTNISDPNTDFQRLLPSSALYESFSLSELGNNKILHLIITAQASQPTGPSPQVEEADAVAPLREFYGTRFRNFREIYMSATAETLSAAAKSSEFRRIQRSNAPIYDGRRVHGSTNNSSTIAMPPSLYHPVFEKWKNDAFNASTEPPAKVIRATAELMRKAAVLYDNESHRSKTLRGPLQQVLGRQIQPILNADRTVADGGITFQLQRESMTYDVPVLIVEEKRDTWENSSDPTTEAIFSMIRVWTDANLDDLCNLTCCPTFLLGFSGCQFTVSAAVITDKCIVERLATLWVGRSSTFDTNRIEDTARVFYALSTALGELEEWYQSDTIISRHLYEPATNTPFNHPRFFPHANQYSVNGEDFDDAIKFEYLYHLETSSLCVTLLVRATTDHSDKFVVKFTQQYCPDLHRLLAGHGMAPVLRYCGKIDKSTPYPNWQMVVMDYYNGSPPIEEPDLEIRKAVKKAVAIGHEAGFVFGDIRRPNVLVGKADGQVKLIDFDWAGKEGEAQYPPDMSDNDALWIAGMEPMEFIQKQHDIDMIDKWFPE